MDELSNSDGFGLSGSDFGKRNSPSTPQAGDFLDGSFGETSEGAGKNGQEESWDLSKKDPNAEQQQSGKISEEDIQKWESEESLKKRRRDYLEERIRISILKYLGDETLNEYVTRIDDVDRIGAENESKVWAAELEERVIPMFVGVRNSFNREIVADAAESYFRDNVPVVGQIISEIRRKDTEKTKNHPREIYLDFLRKFLSAYFNETFSKNFAEIKKVTKSQADVSLSRVKVKLEDKFMKEFDSVKFNSFDEDAIFKKTEGIVLEELRA